MTRASLFKNRKILITGHTGFVGSWLTLWLSRLYGANVIGFSLKKPVSKPSLHEILSLGKAYVTDTWGDVRGAKSLNKVIRDYQPEIIFHLAAQPILLDSYNDPVGTYSTNAIGTLNLLEAERRFGKAKVVVNVTTDKVYQNEGLRAYKEHDKLGGFDPYSSSKACSELITQAYRNSFLLGMGVATARAGNILGGGDFGRYRIVPDIFRSSGNITLRNPESIRPFTFVLDVLDGYLNLAEKLHRHPEKYSEAWNFSSNYLKTVENLVDAFNKVYPITYNIKRNSKNLKHEDKFLFLDSAKARTRLRWKPKLGFEETVKKTADWYITYLKDNKTDMLHYSENQIRSFSYL